MRGRKKSMLFHKALIKHINSIQPGKSKVKLLIYQVNKKSPLKLNGDFLLFTCSLLHWVFANRLASNGTAGFCFVSFKFTFLSFASPAIVTGINIRCFA